MSLITRCPACGTMFKVVPDQLRISEGWVRCGHCSEVFDASANLQQDAVPAGDPGAAAAPERADAQYEDAAEDAYDDESRHEAAEQPAQLPEPSDEEFASSLNTELDEALPSEAPDSEQLAAEAHDLRETPLDRPFELHRQDVGEIAEPPPARFIALPQPEPELHDLSFVRQARRQAFWRSPGMRGVLALVLLALAFLLAAAVRRTRAGPARGDRAGPASLAGQAVRTPGLPPGAGAADRSHRDRQFVLQQAARRRLPAQLHVEEPGRHAGRHRRPWNSPSPTARTSPSCDASCCRPTWGRTRA